MNSLTFDITNEQVGMTITIFTNKVIMLVNQTNL